MTPHPHKDILIAIANGLPVSEVEVHHSTWANDTWGEVEGHYYDIFKYPQSWQLRIKPIKQKTVTFNGIELPEPVTAAPEVCESFYIPKPDEPEKYHQEFWNGGGYDKSALKRGLVHRTKEAAIAWADAMTPIKDPT